MSSITDFFVNVRICSFVTFVYFPVIFEMEQIDELIKNSNCIEGRIKSRIRTRFEECSYANAGFSAELDET